MVETKPHFTEKSINSKAGYFQISWRGDLKQNCQFELQRSFPKVETIYRGKAKSSFISGKKNGKYRYQLQTICPNGKSKTSEELLVTVKHYNSQIANSFFAVGLLSFVILAAVIFYQDAKTKT